MNTLKPLPVLMLFITSSTLFAQSKGEMPFTSTSPNANKQLRQAWVALFDAKFDEAREIVQQVLKEDPDCGITYCSFYGSSPRIRGHG